MEPSNPTSVELVAAPTLTLKQRPAHSDNFSHAKRTPRFIVLHATHGAEGINKDEQGSVEIANPLPKGKRKSYHYIVDADSATCCVEAVYTAWHAGKTGNQLGIGIEICGRADQTLEQWLDQYSLPTLQNAIRLCVDLCREWRFPAVLLDQQALLAGHSGITTHAIVSHTWKDSDHWDPGPGFPLNPFIEAVKRELVTP